MSATLYSVATGFVRTVLIDECSEEQDTTDQSKNHDCLIYYLQMAGFLKALRLLGDEGRVRILRLLEREELSVAELQEILGMGQSRISMQLSQLKSADLVDVRRVGQKSLYRLTAVEATIQDVLRRSAVEITAASQDDEALRLILRKRKDKLRGYFD